MNEQENHEAVAVTPPPFRPKEVQQDAPTATSPSLAEQIATLGLDEAVSNRLTEMIHGMESLELTPEVLSTLARGITHDEDVQNADAAGYLRGKNEKIEAVMHQQSPDDDTSPSMTTFPRYKRRSIWER